MRLIDLLLRITLISVVPLLAQGDSCNVDLAGSIRVAPDVVSVSQNGKVLEIGREVVLDSQVLSVDDNQAQLVAAYEKQIRQTIPAVVDLVLDSYSAATLAIRQAFSDLFGGALPADLGAVFAELDAGVQQLIARSGDRVIVNFGVEESLQRMEPLLARAMAGSVTAMSNALLVRLFSGNQSDVAKMAKDAEAMTSSIEKELQARRSYIDERAKLLCEQLATLGQLETEMHQALPPLAEWDIVHPAQQR